MSQREEEKEPDVDDHLEHTRAEESYVNMMHRRTDRVHDHIKNLRRRDTEEPKPFDKHGRLHYENLDFKKRKAPKGAYLKGSSDDDGSHAGHSASDSDGHSHGHSHSGNEAKQAGYIKLSLA